MTSTRLLRVGARSAWLLMIGAGCAPAPDHRYVLQGSGPELYQEVLVPVLFEPWAVDLVRRAGIRPTHRVLDIATGTGIVARKAAAATGPAGRVDALDINPAMLAVARATHAQVIPPIRWRQGDALDLPYADATFDVVLCQQGLQFFPDPRRAVAEMARVLAPGGRLAISVWRAPEHNPYAAAFARAVDRHVGSAAGAEVRSPFAFDDVGALTSMLNEAALQDIAVQPVELTLPEPDLRRFVLNDILAYPTTGPAFASWDGDRKEALIAEVMASLSPYRRDAAWVIPWSANVATARK